MGERFTLVIIFASIWIAALIVSGSLAIWWRKKFKNFKIQKKLYQEMLTTALENYNLKPIEIEYPLPVGETAYASLTTKLFYKKIKEKHFKTSFFENNFKNDYRLFYSNKKLLEEECRVILTNKRLLLEAKMEYLIVKLTSKSIIHEVTFSNSKTIFNGFELNVLDKRFLIACEDNFDLILAYKKIKEHHNE
ncbi:hypothetical protein [Spiroplasma clarkii]|uniref:Uncharacterized protein n=1 Tax=Spiroplasma clarkii TaxID=2139 RepID=A0A2K8KGT1_9MOLU|nr:hypothetical protein [Spiroplasma clarkii]ATX70903.1 hypothetical protein SCLAR_v1c05840 [Spiroplasma clarkii]